MLVANKNWKLFLLHLLGLSGIFIGCTHKPQEDLIAKRINEVTLELRNTEAVKSAAIMQKMFPLTVTLPGRIAIPDRDILVLSARVSGRLESVFVSNGDRIAQGQIVGQVWSPDLAAAAEELSIAEREKNSELIHLTHEKLKALGLDPRDCAPGRTVFPLRSPISGIVLDRKLGAGAGVNPGDGVMTIGKWGALQFQGELSPAQAVGIRPGMKVSFEDYPDLAAEVEAVASAADPVTRLIRVRCKLLSSLPKNMPQETFLKGNVVLKEEERLVTSAKALIFSSKGDFAIIRDSKSPLIFKKVPIQVIVRNKEEMALRETSEIKAGVVIVGEGSLLLNDVLEGEE